MHSVWRPDTVWLRSFASDREEEVGRVALSLGSGKLRQSHLQIQALNPELRQYPYPLIAVPCFCVLVNRAHEAPPTSVQDAPIRNGDLAWGRQVLRRSICATEWAALLDGWSVAVSGER